MGEPEMDEESSFPSIVRVAAFLLVGAVAVAILWPNSLVNPVRQPLTKVNGELRSIGISIFDLESARKIAPTPLHFSNEFVFGSVDDVFPDLVDVIDPVEIGDLFKDEYHPSGDLYRAAAWKDAFVLISVGPDQILNVTEEQIKEAIEDGGIGKRARLEWSYSPTNGSESSGDIFRVQE
jgi:hypothetical protein